MFTFSRHINTNIIITTNTSIIILVVVFIIIIIPQIGAKLHKLQFSLTMQRFEKSAHDCSSPPNFFPSHPFSLHPSPPCPPFHGKTIQFSAAVGELGEGGACCFCMAKRR